MSDPQHEIRVWMAEQLAERGHGAKSELAAALKLRPDAITRILNTDPEKEIRKITANEIVEMWKFFGSAPPGFSGASNGRALRHDQAGEDDAYSRERWSPKVGGALPELDVQLGAGEGRVGEVMNIPIGSETYSGHKIVAEWLLSSEFLRHEAKASVSNTIVMQVIGDSMMPNYMPGDRVLVDLSQTQMIADTVYAISDGTSAPQIKRLQRVMFSDPTQVKIISDNPALEVQTVDLERLQIIGRVCGHIARR